MSAAGVRPEERLAAFGLAAAVALPVIRVAAGGGEALYALPVLLLGVASVWTTVRRGSTLPPMAGLYLLCTVALLLWLVLTASWTVSSEQYLKDLVLILGLLCILGLAGFSMSENVTRATLAIVVWVGGFTAVWLVWLYVQAGTLSGYSLPIGHAYLPIAQLLGAAAVASASVSLCWRETSRWWLVGMFVAFAGVGLSMARGALLSAIGVVVLVSMVQGFLVFRADFGGSFTAAVSRKTWRRVTRLLLTPVLTAFTLLLALQIERTATRLRRMFSGTELETGGRGWIWGHAWSSLAEAPIVGYGLGSSGLMSGQSDGNYAHNLVLQVWIDGGVIAAMLLLTLLLIPFVIVLPCLRWDRPRVSKALPFLAVYLFMILEFSKSTNFYSGRGFFVFGLLSAVVLGGTAGPISRRHVPEEARLLERPRVPNGSVVLRHD